MELMYERSVVLQSRTFEGECGISTAKGDVVVLDLRRVQVVGDRLAHTCNGCGEIGPDVDLWAEEFGDQRRTLALRGVRRVVTPSEPARVGPGQ